MGSIVYLTGAHTWTNLQDADTIPHPTPFDFQGYLDSLASLGLTFMRLWTWEQARWSAEWPRDYWIQPNPYQRTGPGTALDGEPRFDLTRFNSAYFQRLRARVRAAADRGVYVSIMLFNGWSVATQGRSSGGDPWRGHPFNAANNINRIDGHRAPLAGGRATHTLQIPRVVALQEAYVRHVIDAVNGFDNVLYEISNESIPESKDWQYHMIRFIKAYEAGLPKQHPVGMTVPWPDGENAVLFDSPADWISPNGRGGFRDDPPPADGRKVVLLDTDHTCGVCGSSDWVWRTFTRGLEPLVMDPWDGRAVGQGALDADSRDPRFDELRRALGQVHAYAGQLELANAVPAGHLASTGYCLEDTTPNAHRYVVYAPDGGTVTVRLPALGRFRIEWLNPATGMVWVADSVVDARMRRIRPPFDGPAVLLVRQVSF